MSTHPEHLAPAPSAAPATAHPATPVSASAPSDAAAALDAHGFHADDYDWLPVARRARADGWTAERQRSFIDHLSQTGLVGEAAEAVGMSVASAYRLRRARGSEQFDRAWSVALQSASQSLVDLAYERAINGQDVPVFDGNGRVIRHRRVVSDRLLMFLLRAHQPQIYGPDAGRAIHHPRTVHIETHPAEHVGFRQRQETTETVIERASTVIAPPGPVIGAAIADTLDALIPERPADPVAAMPAQARDGIVDHIERRGLDSVDTRFANDMALAQWRAEQAGEAARAAGEGEGSAGEAEPPAGEGEPAVDAGAAAADPPSHSAGQTLDPALGKAARAGKRKMMHGRDLSDLSPSAVPPTAQTIAPPTARAAPLCRPEGVDPGYIVPPRKDAEDVYHDRRMMTLAATAGIRTVRRKSGRLRTS